MSLSPSILTVLNNGMIFRLRKPVSGNPSRVHVLLHGWTGDENSMNPFWNYFPAEDWLIAPRAPQAADPAGYGWAQIKNNLYPGYKDFLPAAEQLVIVLKRLCTENHILMENINLIGFSQGAAISYLLAALIPEAIHNIVSIAGFLPDGTLAELDRKGNRSNKFAILHGAVDKLVPVQMAKETVDQLNGIGYTTTFCIDEKAGHKLGAACVPDLIKFVTE